MKGLKGELGCGLLGVGWGQQKTSREEHPRLLPEWWWSTISGKPECVLGCGGSCSGWKCRAQGSRTSSASLVTCGGLLSFLGPSSVMRFSLLLPKSRCLWLWNPSPDALSGSLAGELPPHPQCWLLQGQHGGGGRGLKILARVWWKIYWHGAMTLGNNYMEQELVIVVVSWIILNIYNNIT